MQDDLLYGEISDFKKIIKPWGHEVIWANSSLDTGYVGKLLHITAGHRLSLQFHREKEETIFVKSGILYLETIGHATESRDLSDHFSERKVFRLLPGNTFHIPRLFTHRFMAKETDVELIEISTKQLDDIVRIEDDYGR
jgi:mannose-6-phosphate isomerase-like protein (cupin superfamily)